VFQEFYGKLSEQEKKIFYAAVIVVVLALFDMLFLRPVLSRLHSLDENISEKKNALSQDVRFLSYKDKIITEEEVLKIFETDEGKTEEEIIAGFLKTVELLASESGVNLSKVSPADTNTKKGVVEYFAVLECDGKLEDMMRFIHKIDETKNLLKVIKVDMSGNKASADSVKASMKVVKLIIDPKTIGNYEYTGEDAKQVIEEVLAKEGVKINKSGGKRTGSGSSAGRDSGGKKSAGGADSENTGNEEKFSTAGGEDGEESGEAGEQGESVGVGAGAGSAEADREEPSSAAGGGAGSSGAASKVRTAGGGVKSGSLSGGGTGSAAGTGGSGSAGSGITSGKGSSGAGGAGSSGGSGSSRGSGGSYSAGAPGSAKSAGSREGEDKPSQYIGKDRVSTSRSPKPAAKSAEKTEERTEAEAETPAKLNKAQAKMQAVGEGGRVQIEGLDSLWERFFGPKKTPEELEQEMLEQAAQEEERQGPEQDQDPNFWQRKIKGK